MEDVVIVAGVRTPVGKFQGALSTFSAAQLGSLVVREVLSRARLHPDQVDECIMGNVVSAGLGQNPARQAAIYGYDVKVPGMLVASIERIPVVSGGTVKSFDATAAKQVKGVKHVVQVTSGVAVVADSTWAALKGRRDRAVISTKFGSKRQRIEIMPLRGRCHGCGALAGGKADHPALGGGAEMRRQHDIGMGGGNRRVKDRTQEGTSVGHRFTGLNEDVRSGYPSNRRKRKPPRLSRGGLCRFVISRLDSRMVSRRRRR